MPDLKALIQKPKKIMPGHRACRGCPITVIARHILRATDKPIIAVVATGCLEVTTTIYPQTAWNIPFIHSAFENAAATASGIEAAYKALKKKGYYEKDIKIVVFAGDGGTYDIGLQSLSGALERGHDFIYVCYNNEAYMNTGNQRSSATPYGAATTTTPVGNILKGKEEFRKDLTKIVAAHDIPYVAQTAVSHWNDLYNKAKKAFETKGPCFINVFSPCVLGWKFYSNLTMQISRLAVETGFWPLYEVDQGVFRLNLKLEKRKPIKDYIKLQKRYSHLLQLENRHILEKIQERINKEWEELVKKCGS